MMSCVWAHSQIGSNTMPGQHSQSSCLCWVKWVRVLICNRLHALLAEWLGSFMYHCSNTWVTLKRWKSQQRKWTLEEKSSCCLCKSLNPLSSNHGSITLSTDLSELSWPPGMKQNTNQTTSTVDVSVDVTYFTFTHVPGDCYHSRLRSLL